MLLQVNIIGMLLENCYGVEEEKCSETTALGKETPQAGKFRRGKIK